MPVPTENTEWCACLSRITTANPSTAMRFRLFPIEPIDGFHHSLHIYTGASAVADLGRCMGEGAEDWASHDPRCVPSCLSQTPSQGRCSLSGILEPFPLEPLMIFASNENDPLSTLFADDSYVSSDEAYVLLQTHRTSLDSAAPDIGNSNQNDNLDLLFEEVPDPGLCRGEGDEAPVLVQPTGSLQDAPSHIDIEGLARCEWLIKQPAGHRIEIRVDRLDLRGWRVDNATGLPYRSSALVLREEGDEGDAPRGAILAQYNGHHTWDSSVVARSRTNAVRVQYVCSPATSPADQHFCRRGGPRPP